MYSVTSWLGRIGFDDNPTTAIVLHFFRISAIGSAPRFAANSEPSGTSTLIELLTHSSLLVSSALVPAPTSICRSLPPSPLKFGGPPEIPSIRAAAQSLPDTVNRRQWPSLRGTPG